MTKRLKWRLSSLPTPSELRELVKDKIITQEEAKEILLTSEDIDERDKKSLESEIRFLRELVEKLSNNDRSVIVEKIKYIERPLHSNPWYQPYYYWANGSSITLSGSGGTSSSVLTDCSGTTATLNAASINSSFTDIKTF